MRLSIAIRDLIKKCARVKS